MPNIFYICPVRKLKFLLSLYFLVLSCLPCADAEAMDFNDCTVSEHHSDGTHHDDFCSPFCICSCCGSVVFSQQNPVFLDAVHLPVISENKIPGYDSVFISSFFHNIWQPPKIGVTV